jgi:hypothetical protein
MSSASRSVAQRRLRQLRQRSDGGVVEGAADHGRRLRHLPDRVQPVQPRHQRIVQAGRDREATQRAAQVVRVGGLDQRPRFQHRLGHLLHEKRHAVAPDGDLVEHCLRQPLAVADPVDDELHGGARQPVQDEAGHGRVAGEGGPERRSRGHHDQHCAALHPFQRQLEHLKGCRVDPVHVLDHPHHRPPPGGPDQLVDQGGQGASAALLRRQRHRPVPLGRVQVQQRRQEGARLRRRRRPVGPCQPRLEPPQPALRIVVGVEVGRVGEVLDGGVQRRACVVGRALVPDQEWGSPATASIMASVIRDLPIPASPVSRISCPSPALAWRQRSSSSANS